MDQRQCSECHQHFSRKDAMSRHFRNKHSLKSAETGPMLQRVGVPPPLPQQGVSSPPPPLGSPPPPPPQNSWTPPQQDSEIQFQHPFTMIVSGPTSCGKTFFVKTLLQQNATKVTASIQRIIWLYKR